jgi:hypothetical protein
VGLKVGEQGWWTRSDWQQGNRQPSGSQGLSPILRVQQTAMQSRIG